MAHASRSLSGLERVWLVSDRLWSPFVIQIALEGEGRLDRDTTARALDRLVPAWPGARARLRGSLGWTRWHADGEPPRLTVVEAPWDGRGPAPFCAAPLDPWTGPVLEIVHVGERLVVRAHHAAFDGGAAWAFAEDLGRALRGEPVRGAAFDGLSDVAIAGPGPVATEPPADAVVPLARGLPDAARLAGPETTTWARRTLPLAGSALLPRTLVALARATLWADAPGAPDPEAFLRVSVPVDLRRHAPGPSAANLTGFVRLRIDAADTPASVAAALAAALEAREELAPVRLADRLRALPLAWMGAAGRGSARRALATGRGPTSATVSNLGRQDPAALSHPGFHARRVFWIPPGGPGTPLFVTLVGHPEGVELCAGAPVSLAADGRLDGLLDHLIATLATLG